MTEPPRKSVDELASLLARLPKDASPSELQDYRERVRAGGLEALPSAARANPRATPTEVEQRILALALEFPDWGCGRLAERLKQDGGRAVSSPTIQSLLIKHGLGAKAERIAALETAYLADNRALSAEQEALIARANPAFRERHAPPARPGALLVQECILVGNLPRLGNIYLHAAVDAYNAYAFGFLYPGKRPECAVALLHNDVLPFYERHGLAVGQVLTDSGWEYGKSPYQFYLRINGIDHLTTPTRGPGKHGCFERFCDLAREEFCAPTRTAPPYESVEALQAALDAWLASLNGERGLAGYPNRGRPAAEALRRYVDGLSSRPHDPGALSSRPQNWRSIKCALNPR